MGDDLVAFGVTVDFEALVVSDETPHVVKA